MRTHARTRACLSLCARVCLSVCVQDRMESFWLAETLKYTYMLQVDTADSIDLEKYVMNTVSD